LRVLLSRDKRSEMSNHETVREGLREQRSASPFCTCTREYIGGVAAAYIFSACT